MADQILNLIVVLVAFTALALWPIFLYLIITKGKAGAWEAAKYTLGFACWIAISAVAMRLGGCSLGNEDDCYTDYDSKGAYINCR